MDKNKLEKFTAFMPLSKSIDGGFVGVLSDSSLDRDWETTIKTFR